MIPAHRDKARQRGELRESAFGLAANDNDPAPAASYAASYAKAALIGRLALTAVLIALLIGLFFARLFSV